MSFNKIKFSKYLSYLLRHNHSGLNMTKDGYVMVYELINLKEEYSFINLIFYIKKFILSE